jgi:quinoprotein dehydrogenase-associated probable ABC transporter substrate-binding protein
MRAPRRHHWDLAVAFGTIAVASAFLASGAGLPARAAATAPPLRVCADPNNLPFSNRREEGFDNRIADLVASELGRPLRYVWLPERRGFVRRTLGAGLCDVLLGVPEHLEAVLPTRPYYRSTYVFLSRADDPRTVRTLDDPLLRKLRVGVHMIGDDYQNTPPAHALARRHITSNVVGFPIYGDYAKPNPPSKIVEAVARGDIDLAIVWGPFAGYFAPRQPVKLRILPVEPAADAPSLPFTFAMALGVAPRDTLLRDRLDAILARRHADIERLLDRYGVPRMGAEGRARS